ncbi:MAG: fructosamine kinase, partial [Actinomyces sp.]|nr:fructosamine kinase [Actinomyces sp.]
MDAFRKSDHRPGRILYEVAGLAWLADTPPEAAPVVPVLDHGGDWLEEPRLPEVRPTARAAEAFGRSLAHTHAAGASHLGAPPPHNQGQGWMGLAHLPLPA